MKSRTSFFNAAVFKRDLRRSAPLWGAYLLIWLAAMPMSLISQRDWRESLDMQYLVLEAAVASSYIFPFFYGLAMACVLFACLYRSRSANFFAGLPIRREAFFATKYLTGLALLLLPNAIVAVLTVLAGACMGVNLAGEVLLWLAASALGYVFYFSFAAFCAMVVGHLAALPLLYMVLNFTAVVLEAIVRQLLDAFVYGFSSSGNLVLTFLSPVVHAQRRDNGLRVLYREGIEGYQLENWRYLLLLAAAGAAFALLAFWMYRKRRMESAGDVIAVRHLKPVFLYCFTVGCSLVIGWMLKVTLISGSATANFLPILACLLVGAVIGFFGGEMMLQKSLRVFRKRNWARCAVACAVIGAALCGCRFDLFGYSRYVPAPEQVAAVSLDSDAYSQDTQLIAGTAALHRDIIRQQTQTEQELRQAWGPTIQISYRLENGREVSRCYRLPVYETEAENRESLIRRYEDLYNDPDYIVLRSLPADYRETDLVRGYVNVFDNRTGENKETYLSASQAYQLLKTAVEPDLRTTNMAVTSWTESTESTGSAVATISASVNLEFEFQNQPDTIDGNKIYHLNITDGASRTIQALIDLGALE